MLPSILQSSTVPLGLVAEPLVGLGGAPPAGKSLNFSMQHQRQTQWCWAAVTASVAAYYRQPNWSQCRVVTLTLNQGYCCYVGVDSSASCNQPWYLDRALNRVGYLGDFTSAPLSSQQVVSEIDANRPVGVRIGWHGGGGHFVSIGGYSQNVIDVCDPWFGSSSIDYITFRTRYQGMGHWTHSYLTAPKGNLECRSNWRVRPVTHTN